MLNNTNQSSVTSDFSTLVSNGPTDIPGFEKEISKQIAAMSQMVESSNDMEELIVAALKRRCNDRRTVMHAHLRLKTGANSEACTMKWNELADLAEMVASKNAANPIFQQLANFYVRIACLHNRIQQVRQPAMNPTMQLAEMEGMHNTSNHRLLASYAKNEENLHEKHRQNHRELDQIMQRLFLESADIHPELTHADLPALEMQVEHIAQRGCAVQELQRLKIMEALLEEDRFNKLMQELTALTK
jgi:hypothetical protein